MHQMTHIICISRICILKSAVVSYLRPLPGDFSDAVSMIEERLVLSEEDGVFKQSPVLLALFPQGWELLLFKQLHRREHPAVWSHTQTEDRNELSAGIGLLQHPLLCLVGSGIRVRFKEEIAYGWTQNKNWVMAVIYIIAQQD